jgi:DNA-directed RNA polymerase subunit RPC12/RpoP
MSLTRRIKRKTTYNCSHDSKTQSRIAGLTRVVCDHCGHIALIDMHERSNTREPQEAVDGAA